LGIKCLIVKGDSQLVVNFSNKSYTLRDEHMATYLEEHRKMEKCFQGLELKHIPWGENVEADEIAKHISHRLAQPAGVFKEHLFKPSASPSTTGSALLPTLLPPPEQGPPDYGPSLGNRVFWHWQGRREWIGSSSSRPSSSAASFPRMIWRLKG
jgi:hypothetical protein